MTRLPLRRAISAVLSLVLAVPMVLIAPSSALAAPVQFVTDYRASGTKFADVAVDTARNRILVVNQNTAGQILQYTIQSAPAGTDTYSVFASGFKQPEGVAIDPAGNVWVCDTGNNLVKKLDGTTGAVLLQLSEGMETGDKLKAPSSIDFDDAGNAYLADRGNNRILRYTAPIADGAWAADYRASSKPEDMLIARYGGDERLYLTSSEGYVRRITDLAFTPATTVTNIISGLNNPMGVAMDESVSSLFTADQAEPRVKAYGHGGASAILKYGWGTNSSGPQEYRLAAPAGLDISSDHIFVADQTGANSRVRVYRLDQSKPWSSHTVSPSSSGWHTSASFVATLTAEDAFVATPGPWCIYSFDGGSTWMNTVSALGDPATAMRPVVFTGASLGFAPVEGKHVLKYYAVDEARNEETINDLNIWIDDTPPQTSNDYETRYPSGYAGIGAVIGLAATDPLPAGVADNSGVYRTYYRLRSTDGWSVYPGSPVSLPEGSFRFEYYSVDVAGNTEMTGDEDAPYRFQDIVVDKTGPLVQITRPANGSSGTAQVTPAWTVSDSVDNTPTVTYTLTRNGTPIVYTKGESLAQLGTYVLTVVATDDAGNRSEATVTFAIIAPDGPKPDLIAPSLDILGVSNGAVYTDTRTPTAVTDDPTAVITATLNGSPYVLGTPISANGTYTLVVTATDPAGNKTIKTVIFTIDNTALGLEVEGVADGQTYEPGAVPTAEASDPQATVSATLNGAPYVLGTPVTEPGDYVLVVTATDGRGRTTTTTVRFSIRNAPTPEPIPVVRVQTNTPTVPLTGFSAWAWTTSEVAILARDESFASSVAGSALAGHYSAPVLLSSRSKLTASTQAELARLGVKTVIIVGDTKSGIKSAVDTRLKKLGYKVVRLGGYGRYNAALKVAAKMKSVSGTGLSKTAIVMNGRSSAHSVGVSALAYQGKHPVLLVEKNKIPAGVLAHIKSAGYTKIIVVGGTGEVSSGVLKKIDAVRGVAAVRVSGKTSHEVAGKLAEIALAARPDNAKHIAVVTARTWVHGALAGIAAAKNGAAIVTSLQGSLPVPSSAFIQAHNDQVELVSLMGSEKRLSEKLIAQIRAALGE